MKNEKQTIIDGGGANFNSNPVRFIVYVTIIVAGVILGLYFINKPNKTATIGTASSTVIKLEDYKLIRDLVAQTNLNTENIKKIVEWININKPETPAQ